MTDTITPDQRKMKFLLKRMRQSGASSSRVSGIIVLAAFLILSALFGARAPVVQKAQTQTVKPAPFASTSGFVGCSSLTWTQLSPTGTGPDVNSQQFVSDGHGNLIMFGGCGP